MPQALYSQGSGVPRQMSYQGVLREGDKVVADGKHTLQFKLYTTESGGQPIWQETQLITMTGGLFNVTLGVFVDLPAIIPKDAWIGISIDNSAELIPRTKLMSAPYSFNAGTAQSLSPTATGAVLSLNGQQGAIELRAADGFEVRSEKGILTIGKSSQTKEDEVLNQGTEWVLAGNGNATANSWLGTNNNIPLIIRTNNAERMRILSSNGNVGIGETAPNSRLSVARTLHITNTGGTPELKLSAPSGANSTTFKTTGQSSNITYTLPADDGDAGDILSTDGTGILTWSAGGWGMSGNAGAATHFLGTTNAQPLIVRTNNTERYRVTSGGSIGINEDNPTQKLEVAGNVVIKTDGSGTGELRLQEPSSTMGNNYTGFKAGNLPSNIIYTLPAAQPLDGQILSSNPQGILSWVTPTSGASGAAGGDLAGTYPNPTIANDAVTSAKIANNAVDGTKIALGSDVNGDMMYYDGTDYVRLPIGSSGQQLTVSSGIPTWSSPTALSLPTTTINGSAGVIRQNNQIIYHSYGNNTTFFGEGAGNAALATSTTNNVGIGYSAMYNNTSNQNTVVGVSAMYNNSSGGGNTAVGFSSLSFGSSGNLNSAFGQFALVSVNGGNQNVGIGYQAGNYLTTGSDNVYVGGNSGSSGVNTTGSNNTFVGASTGMRGATNTSYSSVTLIGYNSNMGADNLTNATAIGAGAIVSADNSIVLGNNANIGIGTSTPNQKLEIANGNVLLSNTSGSVGSLQFQEQAVNGSNYVGFRAPNSIAADVTWTLPAADGTSGQVLSTNGSGTLTWTTAGGTVNRNSTLSGDGSSGNPLGINLSNSNTWTANQTFASSFLIASQARIALTNADNNARDIRWQEPSGTGSQYIGWRAPNVSNNGNYVFPATVGSVGQVLSISTSNGIDSARTQWTTVLASGSAAGGDLSGTYPNPEIAAGTIVNADINASAAIAYSKLNLSSSIATADIANGAVTTAKISSSGANSGDVLTYNGTNVVWMTPGGGGSLTHFTESVNTAGPNTAVPVVRLLATNAATNVDVALSPKGQGALTAQLADGTATGGNKRGQYAVDWQLLRNASSQVASGNYSTVSGGVHNTASGEYSTIGGGQASIASGMHSTVSGGVQNTANGGFGATVGGGQLNTASGDYSSVAGGIGSTASAQYSTIGGGASNTASAQYSTIGGGLSNAASGDYSAISGGRGLTLDANADRSFGFHGNTSAGDRNMTISAANTAVFGNVDLWLASNDNTPKSLRFYEQYNTSGAFPNGSNYVGFRAPNSIAADVTYTLPAAAPTSDGQVLSSTTAGVMSWVTPGGGGAGIEIYNITSGTSNTITITNTSARFHRLDFGATMGSGTTITINLASPSSYDSGTQLNFFATCTNSGGSSPSITVSSPSGQIYLIVGGAGNPILVGTLTLFSLMTDGTNWYRVP